MITIVTTTAGSVVDTSSLALIAICTVLLLLLTKEMISISTHDWAVRLSTALNVPIVPLLMVFSITVVTQVLSVLKPEQH